MRLGVRGDLPHTGALAAQREGGLPADWIAQHARRFETDGNQLFVVEAEGAIIGYGVGGAPSSPRWIMGAATHPMAGTSAAS